jgi:hypothetical protein
MKIFLHECLCATTPALRPIFDAEFIAGRCSPRDFLETTCRCRS